MNFSQCAGMARLDRSACPGLPPRLVTNTDQERAPITFGWWAQTPCDRVSKHFHLETLYRLDRIERRGEYLLEPSQFFGMSEAQARAHVLARQMALLPKLPDGYRWIGPTVVENTHREPRTVARPVPAGLVMQQKLATAEMLAASVLRKRAAIALQ